MKTIKLFDGIRVTIDGESEIVEDGFPKVWEILNMTEPFYDDCKTNIVRELLCFGHFDMSPAYQYKHSVVLDIIPCKKQEEDCNEQT